uniref:Integrase zinc-binding domain-containing protein n=1 Tax=Chromera velia CCMP2878 TaxID=1169474 RepID=A0A0G4G6I7_9ALVE|eukprot:Cvel_20437.t1-p1 / transcript=Cvel_20437.t1 / gene=Cvel_20437 / organism=Chromera_velia_CCMP2878 / gene_product=hypothetical protein / transcript_product=hypothetical protein / location=Cvel_scaffold1832:6463-7167(+) / protein_length=235 / sequence_SO=supercontig / SO=protein_coding / is_pseudo=false
MRWSLKLAIYDYDIIHKPGKKHTDANSLTRPPFVSDSYPLKPPPEVTDDSFMIAAAKKANKGKNAQKKKTPAERAQIVEAQAEQPLNTLPLSADYDIEAFQQAQRADPSLSPVITYLKTKVLPPGTKDIDRIFIASPAAIYTLHEGLLVRIFAPANHHREGTRFPVMVPTALRPKLLQDSHEHICAGHPRAQKMFKKISSQFFWPSMTKNIANYVKTCKEYQKRRGKAKKENLMT